MTAADTPPHPLAVEIERCERGVWLALVAGDAKADRAALAADFLGLYPDGFGDRAAHVGQLAGGPTVARFALSDVRVRALGPDHVLIAYHARYLRTGAGRKDEEMFVSSIWRRAGSGWENLFSQDTPVTGIAVP
ncbi:nuclear transport factor 2 family protein [Rhodobacter sp. Har01]|uniref:nuclear transport factor 2 family protein n=1 Tax=Rhodobacter sp. Har01 TaxID=2883999 RepID=UPI001D062917|nr:nuclear transport factor 2 family protein [Rhodobacter sp. Har01]MCB6179175.1 nuclear transport factor 2 family protein [Rhodobacter sp. Har01]